MAGLFREQKKKPLWGTCIGIYAGQYYDSETGLHYNWNRYYDPSLGRYLRTDPNGIDSGVNLYLYTAANPLRWIDPEGLEIVGTWARKPSVENFNFEINRFRWDYGVDDEIGGGVRFGYADITLFGDIAFTVFCEDIKECEKNRSWWVRRKYKDLSINLSVPIKLNGWPKSVKIMKIIRDTLNNMNLIQHLIQGAKVAYPILDKTPTAICKLFPNG